MINEKKLDIIWRKCVVRCSLLRNLVLQNVFKDLHYFCCGLHFLCKWTCQRTQVCLWGSAEVHQSWMERRRFRTASRRRSSGLIGRCLHLFKGNILHIKSDDVQFRDICVILSAILSATEQEYFCLWFQGVFQSSSLRFWKVGLWQGKDTRFTPYVFCWRRLMFPYGYEMKFLSPSKLSGSLL